MFTGIIDHRGIITEVQQLEHALRLTIKTQFSDFTLGESIAVDGICLTVTDIDKESFSCDVSKETLRVTTASNFKKNTVVNLERALLASSRIGGHFVTGHIDLVIYVSAISKVGDFVEMVFSGFIPAQKKFLIPKGSVAINGVSLTVNQVTPESFSVMLIPHTLEKTNLSALKINDAVNLEFDMIARVIAAQIDVVKEDALKFNRAQLSGDDFAKK